MLTSRSSCSDLLFTAPKHDPGLPFAHYSIHLCLFSSVFRTTFFQLSHPILPPTLSPCNPILPTMFYQPVPTRLTSHHSSCTSCSSTLPNELTHSPCSKDTCLPCCQSSMAIGHKHCSDNILSLTGIIGSVCLGAVRLWTSGQSFLGLPAAISNT